LYHHGSEIFSQQHVAGLHGEGGGRDERGQNEIDDTNGDRPVRLQEARRRLGQQHDHADNQDGEGQGIHCGFGQYIRKFSDL